MTLEVDLYWSFRSPYSYLATKRLMEMEAAYDVAFNVKIVAPLAIRQPDFFERSNPGWLMYTITDVARLAEYLDLPIGAPNPDPIVQNIETREIAKDQPHIFRLLRLGTLAAEQGKGLPFIYEVSTLIWGGKVKWNEGNHLRAAADRAGLDFGELERRAVDEADRLDAVGAQNEKDQLTAGHWGVPLMVFQGEPFFGQDRIPVLEWRLKQHGLIART